jgi:spore coat polysaccharide biosynthesis predicted glycosyltransferase SpsG
MMKQISSGVVFVIPYVEKGGGGGHLIRSAALVADLRQNGREAFLFIEKHKIDDNYNSIYSKLSLAESFDTAWVSSNLPMQIAFIVIDGFKTSYEDFLKELEELEH